MRIFMVFFIFITLSSCKKEKCYDCTQEVYKYTNIPVKGYPQHYSSKFVSCGEHIELIDDDKPWVSNEISGDTIYTLYIDTQCEEK
jgi:hypothetical protein